MYKCFRPSTILSSWNDDDLILNVPKPSLILILNHQFKDLSYVFFFLSRFHSCRTPLNSVIGHSDRSIKYRCLVNGRNQANAQLNQPKFHAIQWHIHHATYLSVISETNIFSFNSPAFLMCVLWVAWNESLSRTLMNTSIGTGKRAFRSIRWIFFLIISVHLSTILLGCLVVAHSSQFWSWAQPNSDAQGMVTNRCEIMEFNKRISLSYQSKKWLDVA